MELFIESKIEGEFEGFDGDRIYTLVNGMQFQQARYKYKYRYKYRPLVKIWRDGGKYLMEVDGMDEMIEVRRI